MLSRVASLSVHRQPALDRRVWVAVILLLGMLLSSLGHFSSHAVAALAVSQDYDDAAHGHSHDAEQAERHIADDDAGHAHHNSADHSHDKAHALPLGLGTRHPGTPIWRPLAHPLETGRDVFRLDRPPMS